MKRIKLETTIAGGDECFISFDLQGRHVVVEVPYEGCCAVDVPLFNLLADISRHAGIHVEAEAITQTIARNLRLMK